MNHLTPSLYARNRCVGRTINGFTTLYVFDEWELITDLSQDNTDLAKYIHGAQIDEILATLIPNGTQFTSYHHHRDGLGSVTALTDADGNPVERYTYDIYGAPSFYEGTGAPLAQSAVNNRWLFTGREWHSSTGLYDHRNRLYSAGLGRWLTVDPIGDEGGNSLYVYVVNNPAYYVDPMGLQLWGPPFMPPIKPPPPEDCDALENELSVADAKTQEITRQYMDRHRQLVADCIKGCDSIQCPKALEDCKKKCRHDNSYANSKELREIKKQWDKSNLRESKILYRLKKAGCI